MAYVAITGQLHADIRHKIEKMREQERATLPPVSSEVFMDPNDPLVLKLIWGDHLHLKDQIPPEWKTTTPKLNLRYKVQMEHDYNNAYLTIQPVGGGHLTIPRTGQSTSYSSDIVYQDEAQCPPEMAAIIARTKAATEIDSRWSNVKRQVKEFLDNCKSLNEALKLWPQLRIYIPQSYLDRMEKNSPSAKKNAEQNAALEALKNIDTDFVVAAAVGARMAQAAHGQST